MTVPSVHFIQHIQKILFTLLFFIGFLLGVPSQGFAAEILVSPLTGSYSVGQSFTVTVQTNPQGKSVNAVETKMTFDNTKLSVSNISKTGSVFTLWTTEPTFSNTAGTISFGGGSPTPFSTKSNLVSITFKVLKEGDAKVAVSSGSVLAADGLGTDVYSGAGNATFTGTAATETPKPKPEPTPTETQTPTPETKKEEKPKTEDTAITFGDPPRAPEAGSTVFLDPEVWYPTKVGIFTWDIPFDVNVMQLDIATSSESEPKTKYDPPINQLSLNETMLVDGVQYLTMRYKNPVGWGGILHRKIMIDTTPPEKFTIDIRAGNSPTAFPLLNFAANDLTSGIKKYQLSIAGAEPVEITPDEAKLGYMLKNLEDGTYTIKVTAYDFAGNKTESSAAVLITAGWHPPVEVVATTSFWDIFKGKNLIIILLVLIIIAQFVYATYVRKQHEQKEQKLRKETKEIQDQMEKIFSALRDEIYDQINLITKHERLSKKEKEAVEGLNQALEVSETLIEKEITDVSKILK